MAGSGLATVMFTDLVGSTRMRERLGDDAADEIGVEHDRIIEDALSSTGGRLVKNLGDGALAVFDSSVDAVVAGQRIQEGVSVYNREADESRQIGVRIGINAGEIATDNGDVIGLPVAVASRVCDKADGGQILITETVRSLIGRRARFPYVSIGAHALKGVDGTVELWSIEDSSPEARIPIGADIPYPAFLARGMPRKLVGREEQLGRLNTAYTRAAETVELVAIIGEPGIGKTSLTSTWCRTAADADATVVAGRCTPDVALPYQPFVEIARSILGARPELLLEIGPAAGNIAQLVPGIEIPPGIPVPIQTDPDTTKYLMAEAFASLLEPRDGEPSAVVVLDDLHWADEHSIAVLSHIVRRDELPALLIGTYRDTDLVRSHPLPQLLADLRREHLVERISLQRLSDGEIGEMISGHFGTAAASDIVQSIAEETLGNPFFVEEITTHLQDEGAIDSAGQWISDTPIGEYGIPEGVREVVGRRLEHLGQEAVSTLEVAAVIGPDFSIDVAGSIAGLDEHAIDEVVDAATNARVIKEGDSADEFAFAHALLRQTLYDDLPIRRRIRLHKAVGSALEARGEPPGILLNHWLNANENSKALVSALAAGSAAEKAYARADVVAHFELAFEIWDDVENGDQVAGISHAQLVIRLTDTLFDFGESGSVMTDRISAELERGDLDDETRALLLHSMARQVRAQGHSTKSEEALTLALDVVPKSPPNSAHAEILASTAANLANNAQSGEAVSVALEALAIARSVNSVRPEMAALATLGTATLSLGRIDESDAYFDELTELAMATGALRYQLIGFVNQASGLAQNGLIERALHLTEQGIARTPELGITPWERMLRGNAADMLFNLGRWDEAAECLDALKPTSLIDFPQINWSLASLALAAERGDDLTTERELERLGIFELDDVDTQFQGPYWECRISDLRWHGHLAAAYEAITVPLQSLTTEDDARDAPRLAAFAIETVADAASLGITEAAWVENARMWHTLLERFEGPRSLELEFRTHAKADLSRAEGHNDPELWRAAVDAWGDQAYYGAKARWRLAQALIEADPTDPAITALLDQAEDVAERLKAQPLLEAVATTRGNTSQ
jgi:class 3 adenylate cyclase/tetratricopeptide (TPR) repeat protein